MSVSKELLPDDSNAPRSDGFVAGRAGSSEKALLAASEAELVPHPQACKEATLQVIVSRATVRAAEGQGISSLTCRDWRQYMHKSCCCRRMYNDPRKSRKVLGNTFRSEGPRLTDKQLEGGQLSGCHSNPPLAVQDHLPEYQAPPPYGDPLESALAANKEER